MATETNSLELDIDEVGSIEATGAHRFVTSVNGSPYKYGFGATEPTVWSRHDPVINDGFNVPDEMGKMWIWAFDTPVVINVHIGV